MAHQQMRQLGTVPHNHIIFPVGQKISGATGSVSLFLTLKGLSFTINMNNSMLSQNAKDSRIHSNELANDDIVLHLV